MQISLLLETLPLTGIFNVLTTLGALLALHVMQATSHYQEDRGDPLLLQWAHRGVLALMALTFLWMLMYGREKDWMPWPPMVAMVFIIDAGLVVRGFILHHARTKLEPRRYKAPRGAATSRQ